MPVLMTGESAAKRARTDSGKSTADASSCACNEQAVSESVPPMLVDQLKEHQARETQLRAFFQKRMNSVPVKVCLENMPLSLARWITADEPTSSVGSKPCTTATFGSKPSAEPS